MATDNIWQMLTDNVGTVVTVVSAIAAVIGALASRAETRKQRQLRTEQLRQTERVAFGVFVATAPFVYGLFWWYGVIELPWGKRSSPSSDTTGRGRPDPECHRDGAAPFAVEAAWGSPGFTPCPSFEGVRPGYVFTTREQGLGYYPDRDAGGA